MDFETILGFIMIASSIFASLYLFGVGEKVPNWVKITAGIFNFFFLVALIDIVNR